MASGLDDAEEQARSATIFIGDSMKFFSLLVYARACAYNEARLVAAEDGADSKVFSAFLVGIFDAPLIMFFLLVVDSLFFGGGCVREFFSSNITSAFSFAFVIFVLALEYFYYVVLKIGLNDARPMRRSIGIGYAAVSIIGGNVLVYSIW
ncbi:MAG: hypothetical protein LAT63_16175 [Marinobacter sp.]|nr:hypothetical protein [Marinobacter sp.]